MEDFLWYCYSNTLNPSTSEDPDAVMNCLEVAIYCGAPNLVHFCELDLDAKLTDFSVSKAATGKASYELQNLAQKVCLRLPRIKGISWSQRSQQLSRQECLMPAFPLVIWRPDMTGRQTQPQNPLCK